MARNRDDAYELVISAVGRLSLGIVAGYEPVFSVHRYLPMDASKSLSAVKNIKRWCRLRYLLALV